MKRTKPAPTGNGLSSKQYTLLEELLKETSVTKVSKKTGIPRSTIYHEMKKPAFKETLDSMNWALSEKNLRHLLETTSKAWKTVDELLDSKDANVRLKAAAAVLKAGSGRNLPKPPKAPLPNFDFGDEDLTPEKIEEILCQLMAQLLMGTLEEKSYLRGRKLLKDIKYELKLKSPWQQRIQF